MKTLTLCITVIVFVLVAASVLGSGNNLESEDFLGDYRGEEDVQVTSSGLTYKVLQSATDPNAKSPDATTPCRVHYRGKTVDGNVFDSSFDKEPVMVTPSRMIKGWTEALTLMREGDRWEVVLPANLAYGDTGAEKSGIKSGDVLIFEIHLVEVDPQFEGMDMVWQYVQRDIPGLPFRLTIWQGVLLAFYMAVRIWVKSKMGPRVPPAPSSAATASTSTAQDKKND